MTDQIDESEQYWRDYYLDNHVKQKSKQPSIRNPLNLEKVRSNILLKVRQLPITRQSAEILYKLVVNHKILDIVKVLKIGSNSVSILAKANVNHKIFEKLKNTDRVLIKVYNDIPNSDSEMIALSQNIHNEEKEVPTSQYPTPIELDKNYLNEKMYLYQMQNIVIMKMFDKSRTISQFLKENPGKIAETYKEILLLICDIVERIYWSIESFGVKNIIRCNEKWIILCLNQKSDICIEFKNNNKVNKTLSNTIIDIINIFHEHEMSYEILEKEFSNIYNHNNVYWSWKTAVHFHVVDGFFRFKEVYGKIPKRYIQTKFPKQPKKSKKSKK